MGKGHRAHPARGSLAAIALATVLLALPRAIATAQEAPPPVPAGLSEQEQAVLEKALRFERELIRLVESVRPASVSIENWQPRRPGGPPEKAGAGSGVIISGQGHILTNQHVVQGAVEIWIALEDHRRMKAELVGNDPRGDVALLKIEPKKIRYKDPRKANPDRLVAGQWVIATGNPFFLGADGEAVVTLGVVSGLGRVLPGEFFYGDAIQHDAKINPGNSGGPLWDLNGNLLGLNGKIASSGAGGFAGPNSSGVGFTIPINQIRNFLESMLEGRKSAHGDELLGIKVETHKDESGTADGAEVKEVTPGSPAALARPTGIQVGDVIVAITIGGKQQAVATATDYVGHLSPLAEGAKITVVVKRGRKRLIIPNIVLAPPAKGGRGGK